MTIISNKFNDLFVNIGPTLAKAIPSGSKLPTDYLGDMIKEIIFLTPVDSLEFKNIILSLKISAAGHDDIGAALLKLFIEHIVAPLTHICNLSLSEGVFPDQLKIANMVPLYKAEDSMMFNNYRPYLCYLFYQRSLRKSCSLECKYFLTNFKYYTSTSSDSGKAILLIWLILF